VGWLGTVGRVWSPIYSLCARSDQSCCSLATTTQPGVAAVRALINKQHNQASHVVALLSFDQNMPRAPLVAPVLGAQRENFGAPEQITGRQQKPGGGKTGPGSGSESREAQTPRLLGRGLREAGLCFWGQTGLIGQPQ
jgi:hypothetical protein